MKEAMEVSPGAMGSAALSLALALLETIVKKGLISKQDALDLVGSLADAKAAKAGVFRSPEEGEAGILLERTLERLAQHLPD